MALTRDSQRTVFQTIARTSYYEWPAYESTRLYDWSSLDRFEEDIRTVSAIWFDHDTHESVEQFVCHLPFAYVDFRPYDRYGGPTRYGIPQLVRPFLLKELHGWTHEAAFTSYLKQRPALCRQLGFETIPDQSTLWRTWHRRFSTELQETIPECAWTVLIKAERTGVDVPRSPRRKADPMSTTKTLSATRRGSRKQTTSPMNCNESPTPYSR